MTTRTPFVAALTAFACTLGTLTAQAPRSTLETELPPPISPVAADQFGSGADVSGDFAIVGARYDDELANGAGAAWVYRPGAGTLNKWLPVQKLLASDGAASDSFGYDVAMDGDTAVIGAFLHDGAGSASGAAYVFESTGTTWYEAAKLMPLDPFQQDQFGVSVAVSGDTILVGSHLDDDNGSGSGSVYVFVLSGGVWTQQAKLVASDGSSGDQFGFSVAIDGDTALVGATVDDPVGTSSGSAYVFTRSGTVWSQQAKLVASDAAAYDQLGRSVDIHGDTAVVGALQGDGASVNSGTVYVFVRTGTTWSQQAELDAPGALPHDEVGASVAIHSDRVIVGRPGRDGGWSDMGSVHVFDRSGTTWTHELHGTASSATANAEYGSRVGFDGTLAIASAPHSMVDGVLDAGAAFVFTQYNGVSWAEVSRLHRPAVDGHHGRACALDGDYAIVGAPYADIGDVTGMGRTGAAIVYHHLGTYQWWEQETLVADDATSGDGFGWGADISGNRAVVGAPSHDGGAVNAGAVYVFERTSDVWNQSARFYPVDIQSGDGFGTSVAVDGSTVVVGSFRHDALGSLAGAAYVFTLQGSLWSQQAKLLPSDGNTGDQFGIAVSISGDTIVVGSRFADPDTTGAAYVYTRNGTAWTEEAKLVPPPGPVGFGWSVAAFGDTALVGAPAGGSTGGAFAYVRTGTTWSLQEELVPENPAATRTFGIDVDLYSNRAVVGDSYADTFSCSEGAAHVFARHGASWRPWVTVAPAGLVAGTGYGTSVAIGAEHVLVGGPTDLEAPCSGDPIGRADIFRLHGEPSSFCDGYDGALASCPCANAGDDDTGCDNAQGTGGVKLRCVNSQPDGAGGGSALLLGEGYPNGTSPGVTVIRSDAPDSPAVFGDGLRCIAASTLVRVGSTVATFGSSHNPINHGAGAGTYYYQLWYRNNPATYCDAAVPFNLSNAIEIVWP